MAGKLTLTVSQLNEYIRRTLQMDPMLHGIELRGEISNLKFHQTGTLFFTLKDESSAISCVMYAQDTINLQNAPFEGMRAVVSGSVGLYVRGGQMQFYANALRAEGVGVLYERLQALKAKLGAMGLFDSERKRPLPACPDTIGVVTSPTGAVIHDILNVSLRRDPQVRILLCPVRVQGIGAAGEVVQGIRMLEQIDSVSVIIVARGGGSMEDLWTFNEESVVRAVAQCRKPVVSAVGHETDVTLCDLAADFRAPTPSAAAECAVPVREELEERIRRLRGTMHDCVVSQLSRRSAELAYDMARLEQARPQKQIAYAQERLERCLRQLHDQMHRKADEAAVRLQQKKRELDMLCPYRVLARGYAMVIKDGSPVKAAAQVKSGDVVSIRFADGVVHAGILCASDMEENA